MMHRLYQVALVLLFLLAFYLLSVRVAITWVQYSPEKFFSFVEQVTNSTIDVDDVLIDQSWLGLDVQILGLKYEDKVFNIDVSNVEFDFNIFSPWLPYIKYGNYFKADQALVYKKDTSHKINPKGGFLIFSPESWPVQKIWKSIKVSDINFQYYSDHLYSFNLKKFQSYAGIKLTFVGLLELAINKQAKTELQFKGSFSTNVWNLPKNGEMFFTTINPLELDSLKPFLSTGIVSNLPSGKLTSNLNLTITDNRLSNLTIEMEALDLSWLTKDEFLPKSLGFSLNLDSGKKPIYDANAEWTFGLNKIHLDGEYLERVSPIQLVLKNKSLVTLSSESFDIFQVKPIMQMIIKETDYQGFGSNLSELVLKDFKGQFDFKASALEFVKFEVPKLVLPQNKMLPGISVNRLQVNYEREEKELMVFLPEGLIINADYIHNKPMVFELENKLSIKFEEVSGLWNIGNNKLLMNKIPLSINGKVGKTGFVDLNLKIIPGNLKTVKKYLPYSLMSEELETWLQDALVSGNNIKGQLNVQGFLSDFPFNNGKGSFESFATIDNAVIQFQPDWPALSGVSAKVEFTPFDLIVTSKKINIGEAIGTDIKVSILNLDSKDIAIDIQGKVKAQASKAIDYLQKIPSLKLLDVDDFIKEDIVAKGDIVISLDKIWVPVYGFGNQPLEVKGSVQLKSVDLVVLEKLNFSQLKGTVYFSESAVRTKKTITGFFESGPLGLTIMTENGVVILNSKGDAKLKYKPLSGNLPWAASLELPLASAQGVRLIVDGGLSQIKSNLPEPLNDFSSLNEQHVRLDLQLTKDSLSTSVKLSNQYYAYVKWSDLKNRPNTIRLTTSYQESKDNVVWPEGIYLSGKVGVLDADGWLDILSGSLAKTPASTTENNQWIASDISIKKLKLFNHELNNIEANWQVFEKDGRDTIALNVSSSELEFTSIKNQNYQVNITKLHLPEVNVESDQPCKVFELDSILPEVKLTGSNVKVGSRKIPDFSLHLKDSSKEISIKNFRVSLPGKGSLTGSYFFDKSEKISRLNTDIRAKEIKPILDFIGVHKGIRGKDLSIKSALSWKGFINCYSPLRLKGQIDFSLGQGVIKDAEPGIARVLGLLSIESLARRLNLDVTDVTNAGLAFDSIQGNGYFNRGIFSLEKLNLEAPAVEAAVFGEINLIQEELRLQAELTPAIGSVLPAVAIISGVATPIAGLTAYAFLRAIPMINEDLITYSYDVRGTFEAPILKSKGASLDILKGHVFEDDDLIINHE